MRKQSSKDYKIGGIEVMEDNENVVLEGTENVEEQATEELVDGAKVTTDTENVEEKLYTQADLDKMVNEKLDALLPKKLERAKAKLSREYEDKLSRVETVLNAGLGTKNLDEATDKLTDFYTKKGIKIPDRQPTYSKRDMELLANAEADDIIKSGYDEIVYEVDRLADKGLANMSEREKLVFKKLAEERQLQEATTELSKLGVGKEILEDSKFKDFANKLNPNLSLTEKYNMYTQLNPKPTVKPIGSMKGNTKPTNEVKDFYSYEESLQFTKADFDKNPALYKAVERSMTKW